MWNLIWALPGTAFVTVIWLASAVANYQYGLTQGTTDIIPGLPFEISSAFMNGYVNLAVDGLKAVLPAMALVAWIVRYRIASLTIVAMFALCLAWSGQNSIGYSLFNHAKAVDGRGQTADQWSALQKSLEETQTSRGLVPTHRPSGVVTAEIEAAKSNRKFAESGGCANAAAARAINFCNDYRGLTAELAAAESADRLDKQLVSLRNQLDSRQRVTDGDPLGTVAALTMGWKRESVATGRSISFSLLVEVISAIGLALIWGVYAASLRDKREKRAALIAAQEAKIEALSAEAQQYRNEFTQRFHLETAPATWDIKAPAELAAEVFADASKNPSPKPTPPSGPRKKKVEPEAELRESPAVEEPADNVYHLPEKASDVFEESAPPKKHTAARRREDRKHRAMGSAREWLEECTERRDMSLVCSPDDAWLSYRQWCESTDKQNLPRSKFQRVVNAKVGSVTVNGKKGFVGLGLLELATEQRRAVA